MSFYFEGGVRSFVRYLNRNRKASMSRCTCAKEVENIDVEVAMQYTDGVAISEYAFANTINTPDGGTHLTGVRARPDPRHQQLRPQEQLPQGEDKNFSSATTRAKG
jgi:DNA gyrase subunit B